jgi:hypothetical protein
MFPFLFLLHSLLLWCYDSFSYKKKKEERLVYPHTASASCMMTWCTLPKLSVCRFFNCTSPAITEQLTVAQFIALFTKVCQSTSSGPIRFTKSTTFWDVTPCSLVEFYWRILPPRVSQISKQHGQQGICSSETSVHFYTTQCHISEDYFYFFDYWWGGPKPLGTAATSDLLVFTVSPVI